MPELHPPDTQLLALGAHPDLGFDFIPTGLTPYFVEFRRLANRIADAARLANDLRPYASGALTLGIYPGRARIQANDTAFAGIDSLALTPSATNSVWIDANGQAQTSTTGFPEDRTNHLRIAQAQTDAQSISQLTDLRAAAAYQAPADSKFTMDVGFAGTLNAGVSGLVFGPVPANARLVDVALTINQNLISDNPNDKVEADIQRNGASLLDTPPAILASDGAGFQSTAQGAGVPATPKTGTDADVLQGDLLTVHFPITANGNISLQPARVYALVIFQPQ